MIAPALGYDLGVSYPAGIDFVGPCAIPSHGCAMFAMTARVGVLPRTSVLSASQRLQRLGERPMLAGRRIAASARG